MLVRFRPLAPLDSVNIAVWATRAITSILRQAVPGTERTLNMTKKERLQIYESFFHQMNVYCTTMNQEKLRDAVALIDQWSYAHRCGNGEYTEHEQKKIVDNVVSRMKEFK